MLVMLDTDRTTLDFCRDTYAIQPAIMNGHLIARTVCIPHSECVRRRPTPDGSFLSTELFVDAARCARQLSTALGCQIAAKSDPEDTPPPYTHTQSKFTAEEPSSAADVSQDNSKAEQNLLRLFSTLLTKRVSERLPKDYSSHTRDQDPVVIILGEKDFERCLEGCTDPKAKAKELQHIPEANDRFGGDDLVWIDGEPGRYGNTGRLLVSVQFDSKYCWAEPDVKMSLAIPTEVNNLTGVPAGVMDLLDTSTALGSAARQQINTALDEFARYWRDPEASMMFQETVGEIQSYRDQNLRSVSQDKAPDVRRLMAAGFVSARVTRLMQSKFGENNYPITSLLLRGTHAKILEDRRCPARELPLSPEDWKLNELIDEKYLVATPASNDGHDETPSVANQSSLSYKVKTWCSKVLGGKSSRD